MDRIGYGKWGDRRAALGVLLCFVVAITAQPGFLNINCGARNNHTDVNKMEWVTDANYIDDLGETADIGNATEQAYGSHLTTLRFFPKPLNKSCYHLPVDPYVPYLLRLWFAAGNYSGFQQSLNFAFSLETNGTLYTRNIIFESGDIHFSERILASSGTTLYICLIRTLESDDPFISNIELRKLQEGMYGQAKPGTILKRIWRTDVGGRNSVIRYPQDNFDRIWTPNVPTNLSSLGFGELVSFSTLINNAKDFPPPLVMQTAWLLNSSEPVQLSLGPLPSEAGRKSLLILYFAETQMLDTSESRSFYVTINGENRSEIITLPRNYSAVDRTILSNQTDDFEFALVTATNSTLPPIINAFEYYTLIDTQPATYHHDVEALVAIKEMLNMKAWISDPCFVIWWNGISCDDSTSAIRISEITLSSRNLTGLVPEQIGQLTSLVTMSLDNNHLTGPLPDFSKLTRLERLHLQNNSLNGSLPDWLSQLKNLKELFIENNNFSGEIPLQLLQKTSLSLNYSGNLYLSIPDPMGHKKLGERLVLGITLSVVVVGVSLIAGIVVYRKKKKCLTTGNVVPSASNECTEENVVHSASKKKKCVTTESSELEIVPLSTSNEPTDATIMVLSSTKAHAFTLDQMMTATKKFSRNIGEGGFGSVFFGKLPEGKDIAVKVLSFSKQGVHQFQNEIDVLSRVHHRNLVSLLGYCNESKELMIIYEYMSRGSLKDCLYGPNAGSELNWKTRVKIALDAAEGLEYMHVHCNPMIIHRYVKTANILLDSNLKGKLGDFGLSKIWIDGEASHMTTMVKGTFGYLDPEYFHTQRLTHTSDVYSFGVVLLEIICGRPPIYADRLNIIQWAKAFVEMDAINGKIEEIVDTRLGGNYNMESLTRVAKVAIRCVHDESFCRPSISEVVAEVREALELEETCSSISNVIP